MSKAKKRDTHNIWTKPLLIALVCLVFVLIGIELGKPRVESAQDIISWTTPTPTTILLTTPTTIPTPIKTLLQLYEEDEFTILLNEEYAKLEQQKENCGSYASCKGTEDQMMDMLKVMVEHKVCYMDPESCDDFKTQNRLQELNQSIDELNRRLR